MADRIKGITVEIGGDTQGLDKALKGVNDTSRSLQKELRDVQKLLKFDPNNAELLAQRQKLLNDQIENTEKKLHQLREAEEQVQEQFKQGKIGAEQYRAFQRELQDTQSYLRNTQNAVADLNAEQKNIKKSTSDLNHLFEVTGQSIEDFADIIGDRTVRAIQQGTASAKDLDKAFDKIAQASIGAGRDVGEVREALKKLATGEKSIESIRKEMQKLGKDAQDTKGEVKNLGGEIGGMVAGLGAGMGLDAIFSKAMDISNLDTVIEISMDVPEESKQAVKDAITTVGSYIGDNEAALEGVRRQFKLNAGLTDEENTRIVKGAGAIVTAYSEVDFTELIQETHEMALGLEMTHDEALGMTKALLDMGFPADQLDIITEYGQQLARAGYDASEIQAIFEAGIETGTWNIDVLMDGLKEGRILMSEFGGGVDETTQKLIAGTGISATKLQEWGTAIAEGGDKGKTAMTDVATAVMGIEDATKRNEVGVKLFGTLWEENGELIGQTLVGASEKTINLADQQNKLNENVGKLDASPQQQLNQALSDLWTTLTPLLTEVTNFVTKVAEWIQKNPELSATIIAIISVIGILIGIFLVLSPIVLAITGLMGTLGLTIGGIMLPVLIVIGVIAALIAIGVLLYKNWDEIMAWGKKTWQSVSDSFENMWNAVSEWMGNLWQDVKDIWGKVMDWFEDIDLVQTGKDIIQGLIDGVTEKASALWDKAVEIANSVGDALDSVFDFGSPSKLTTKMGEDTGEGLAVGLFNKVSKVQDMSKRLAESMTKTMDAGLSAFTTDDVALTNYFEAIREDGDWLNDWLTHMPQQLSDVARQMGRIIAPELERKELGAVTESVKYAKQLTVNLNSPKALDIREASREFNKTLNKMSLMW